MRSRRSTPAWAESTRDGRQRPAPRGGRAVERVGDRDALEPELVAQQRLDPRRPGRGLGVERRVRRRSRPSRSARRRRSRRGTAPDRVSRAPRLGGDRDERASRCCACALPIPGKCFAVAATRASASPARERGHRAADHRPADAPKVRSSAAMNEPGPGTSATGARSTLTPRRAERAAGEQRLDAGCAPRSTSPSSVAELDRPCPREAAHAPALLVGRDQERRPAARPGRRSAARAVSCAQLGRARDVGAEEDDSTDLAAADAAEERGRRSRALASRPRAAGRRARASSALGAAATAGAAAASRDAARPRRPPQP